MPDLVCFDSRKICDSDALLLTKRYLNRSYTKAIWVIAIDNISIENDDANVMYYSCASLIYPTHTSLCSDEPTYLYHGQRTPLRSMIIWLIERHIKIVGTILLDDANYLYDAPLPIKNTGPIVRAYHADTHVARSISHSAMREVIAVEGIIGAGKTYYLNSLPSGSYIIYEPLDALYALLKEHASSDHKTRRHAIDEMMTKYAIDEIAKVPDAVNTIYIERNWLYSDWIIGGKSDEPYPVINEQILHAMYAANMILKRTHVLWTTPETAIDRVNSRGTVDYVTVDREKSLEAKLRLLFDSDYEWPFANC